MVAFVRGDLIIRDHIDISVTQTEYPLPSRLLSEPKKPLMGSKIDLKKTDSGLVQSSFRVEIHFKTLKLKLDCVTKQHIHFTNSLSRGLFKVSAYM